MSDEKLKSDVSLMKAVEELQDEIQPFIDAQLEARGLSDAAEEDKPVDESFSPNLASDAENTPSMESDGKASSEKPSANLVSDAENASSAESNDKSISSDPTPPKKPE